MITVNAIYKAFQGEVNTFSIGYPCVFLRLAGCHLRCYFATHGNLCDTPESLEGTAGEQLSVESIVGKVEHQFSEMGITGAVIHKVVCLTGGDPLWRNKASVNELLEQLVLKGIFVCVETSGTIDHTPYLWHKNVYWIMDWKLKSAGVIPTVLTKTYNLLREKDYVKFVVYDEEDYAEMKEAVRFLTENKCRAVLSVGAYWGGKIEPLDLFNKLAEDKLLGSVTLNFQSHKLVVAADYSKKIPEKI